MCIILVSEAFYLENSHRDYLVGQDKTCIALPFTQPGPAALATVANCRPLCLLSAQYMLSCR